MKEDLNRTPVSRMIVLLVILSNIIITKSAYTGNGNLYWWLMLSLPLLIITIRDSRQRKHDILRNYPLIGHLRYFFVAIRPELRQYFFDSDLDGKPFNRKQQSIMFKRTKMNSTMYTAPKVIKS